MTPVTVSIVHRLAAALREWDAGHLDDEAGAGARLAEKVQRLLDALVENGGSP